MMHRRDRLEAAQRKADREEREKAAPRLKHEVPTIVGLRLEIEEHRGDGSDSMLHTRHIVVDRAPALFHVPCSAKDCSDGGHDLTYEIMRALRSLATEFQGRGICHGRRYTNDCGRELKFTARATYRAQADA